MRRERGIGDDSSWWPGLALSSQSAGRSERALSIQEPAGQLPAAKWPDNNNDYPGRMGIGASRASEPASSVLAACEKNYHARRASDSSFLSKLRNYCRYFTACQSSLLPAGQHHGADERCLPPLIEPRLSVELADSSAHWRRPCQGNCCNLIKLIGSLTGRRPTISFLAALARRLRSQRLPGSRREASKAPEKACEVIIISSDSA